MSVSSVQHLSGAPLKLGAPSCTARTSKVRRNCGSVVYARERPSVEKLYRIFVEKNITQERANELGVQRWHRWESGKSCHDFKWEVDEQVYITKGRIEVKPLDCPYSTYFYAGDLVRFPKWLVATLTIEKDYEHRYRFLAYGEGEE
ncbi:hypothetical protein KP509_21G071300 [Ceratopteris richardii]|uniref:(S)-ureidoglycine aminohydrolase cupin domain-containing protein n=1 Tax=Ceratopteris richardii TaxID=49495 RepID=A0A8T2SD89_CERRI|nr:hypothetical protein KP509_21G071300 [Ceratopteris richardii]